MLGGEAARVEQELHVALIARDLAHMPRAHEVRARVADLRDVRGLVVHEDRGERRAHVLAPGDVRCLPHLAVRLRGGLLHQLVARPGIATLGHRSQEGLDDERARHLARLVTAHAVGDRQKHAALSDLEARDSGIDEEAAAREICDDEGVFVRRSHESDVGLSVHREMDRHEAHGDRARPAMRASTLGSCSISDVRRAQRASPYSVPALTPRGATMRHA